MSELIEKCVDQTHYIFPRIEREIRDCLEEKQNKTDCVDLINSPSMSDNYKRSDHGQETLLVVSLALLPRHNKKLLSDYIAAASPYPHLQFNLSSR